MAGSRLYVAAYDVRKPQRLRRALRVVSEFSSGGQYSAYECWLDRTDRAELETRMCRVLDLSVDSFMLIPLEHRQPVATLGVARPTEDPDFFYLE